MKLLVITVTFVIFLVDIGILYVDGRGERHEPKFYDCGDKKRFRYEQFCDGVKDCINGEDEMIAKSDVTKVTFNPFALWQKCNNPTNDHSQNCLVSRDQICNGIVSCSNINPCDLKCDTHYKCQDGSCFLRSTVCDNNPCSACPEDHEWSNGVGFKCVRNGVTCIIPQQLLHDDIGDCDGGVDLCYANVTALSRNERQTSENLLLGKCFECLDKSMIVRSSAVCDGIVDCSDLSDECYCESEPEICDQIVTKETYQGNKRETAGIKRCDVGDIQCKTGKCISRTAVCDGIKDCEEDESEDICHGTLPCKNATKQEKCRCVTGHDISCRRYYGVSCNGIAECPPSQDPGYEIYTRWDHPEDECEATCTKKESNFTCEESPNRSQKQKLFGTWCEIPKDRELPEAYTSDIPGDQYCDGVIDCELVGDDESHCFNEYYRFYCNVTRPGYVSISEDKVCDGKIDCIDGLDETPTTCSKFDRGSRFTCSVRGGLLVSIDISNQCDSFINCDDGSDEMNCTNDKRFYCENGDPLFVPENKKFDGAGDCTDWSDECPTRNQSTQLDAFASRYELIDSIFLRILVWIMAFLAITGNIIVLVGESRKLRQRKCQISPAVRANRFLILNLAFADLLMGIYLLALSIMTAKMTGRYCSQDLSWRSSHTCIGLGVLSVLSTETSVITMVLLTGCRLYAVMNPLQSGVRPTRRHVLLFIAAAWAISLFLALLPLTPSLSNIFVSGVKFKYNPFATKIYTTHKESTELFKRMVETSDSTNTTYTPKDLDYFLSTATWENLKNEAPKYFSVNYFEADVYWGYYSTASVCIPKFFISRSDPAWVFSFVINFFNFSAFMFVALAYIGIYRNAKEKVKATRHVLQDEQQTSAMQKKVFRLIVTDFCCWVPICIMAFSKLAGADIGDTAYAVSAIVLLPINSALNPILYSDILDSIIKNLCHKKETYRKSHTDSSKSTHMTRIEMLERIGSTPTLKHKKVVRNTSSQKSDESQRRPLSTES